MIQTTTRNRLSALYRELERVRAEIKAIEDGTLPFLEERTNGSTVPELAEAFSISMQSANNRLQRLIAVGLAEREPLIFDGGGRGYLYHASIPRSF